MRARRELGEEAEWYSFIALPLRTETGKRAGRTAWDIGTGEPCWLKRAMRRQACRSDDRRSGCRWPRRTASARSGGYELLWSRPHYSVGIASDTSARAALAQSTSFCTVGAPLIPIAPTISPSTLIG